MRELNAGPTWPAIGVTAVSTGADPAIAARA